MTQQAQVRNPFMLLLNPEIVLAAIQNSTRLSGLNSKLCRPLDGPVAAAGNIDSVDSVDSVEDGTPDDEHAAASN